MVPKRKRVTKQKTVQSTPQSSSNQEETEWTSDASVSDYSDLEEDSEGETPTPVVSKPQKSYALKKSLGKAIIFVHESFYYSLNLTRREGTRMDSTRLKCVLRKLGFEVEVHHDLPYTKIQEILENVAKDPDLKQASSLVIAVMSHGKNERLFAKDQSYKKDKLWYPFTPDLCPYLAGKPKIFLIQACRGNRTAEGIKVSYENDTATNGTVENCHTIPLIADLLFYYATFEGHVAFRSLSEGSPFIKSLVRKLSRCKKEDDILSILTEVNNDVALNFRKTNQNGEEGIQKQMPTIVSTLTRKFFLIGNKKPATKAVEATAPEKK